MAGECKGTFEDFLNALAQRESSNQPTRINDLGYAGLWQMGEDSLIDAGFYVRQGSSDTDNSNDWTGNWSSLAQSYGVNSITDFLNNPAAQLVAMQAFMDQVGIAYIRKWESYVGQTIAFQDPRTGEYSTVTITESSLLAMYHLGGNSATTKFLKSGGAINPHDGQDGAIGTPVSEYGKLFGGYDAPYGDNGSCSPPRNPIDPNDLDGLIKRLKDLLKNAQTRTSPLVLDLDGDGVETTAINNGAYFDHDTNGHSESTGWVGADDGLLVLDRNGDGRINNGTELFGNQTLLPDGSRAGNGFQALTQWDGNSDGRIDANDAIWSQLQVWRDQNEDGYSQASELYSLSDFGIASLDTGYSNATAFVDAQGNEHVLQGTFTWADGTSGAVTDVWFQSDRTYTIAEQVVDVPADIAAMPDARGYGNVYDLQQAMARDSSTGRLVNLVLQFSNQTDSAERAATLEQILFAWTDSEGIDPASRGAAFDARKLSVLEKFFGEPFQGWAGSNPTGAAVPELTQSYNGLVEMVYAQLMAQTHLRDLYDLVTYQYSDAAGVTGDLTQVAAVLSSSYVPSEIAGEVLFLEFVRSVKAIDSNGSINLDSLRINSQMSWLLDSYDTARIFGNDQDNILTGTAAVEIIRGGAGNDTLVGANRADTLDGGAGDDVLGGAVGSADWLGYTYDSVRNVYAGNTYTGGTGNDTLNGTYYADTYSFNLGDGADRILDNGSNGSSNADRIVLGTGIAPTDVDVYRTGYDLVIGVGNTGDSLTVVNWYDPAVSNGYNNRIESLVFADGTVWSEATLTSKGQDIAPIVAEPVATQIAMEDSQFNFVLPATTFSDPDAVTVLSYAATLADGSALPGWLQFNAATRTFTGTPANDQVGTLALRVIATDNYGKSASTAFDLVVQNVNDVPVVSSAIADQSGAEGSAFSYVIPVTTFSDVDVSDTLHYTATLADGSALPAWLSFDAATHTFNGSPADGTAGSYNMRVTATDSAGASVFDDFMLTVADTIATIQNGTSAANTLQGTAFMDVLNGLGGNDTLYGYAGSDTLDGGAGNDTMVGGLGNDTYVVNATGDIVTENANEGTDTVNSSITYALGNNVENLTLTGSTAINGSGNTLDNVLTGNSANNILNGNAGNDWLDGGAGSDTMKGGTGNDTYVVNVSTDVVTENANEGADTIRSSITWLLGNNLENLTLTGNNVINGTGNSLDNVILGNSAANTLTGNAGNDTLQGFGGNDTLKGGTGNDTYVFGRGDGQDVIQENDTTAGNQDTASLGVNALDTVFTQSGNNLVISLHGGTDTLTVQNWYTGTQYQTEVIEAQDGTTLTNTQVDQLIQAMATFCANNGGISWDQAITQNPNEVQAVLTAYWQPAA